MKSRKYESPETAVQELSKIGKLMPYAFESFATYYTFEHNDGRKFQLRIDKEGLVSIHVPDTRPVVIEKPPAPLTKEERAELYKDGICECKTKGKYRWETIKGERLYKCIKCNRPKYWTMAPPTK